MNTYKIEQLKWVYGGFSGICLAFFLTILGANQSIGSSMPLFLSSIGFGACLPIFTVFTLVHAMFLEERRHDKEMELALSAKWIQRLTQFSVLMFCLSITFMLFHISKALGVVFLMSAVVMLLLLKKFRGSLHEAP